MREPRKLLLVWATWISVLFPFAVVFAEHGEEHRGQKKGHHGRVSGGELAGGHQGRRLAPAANETYKQECGACHFVYQPGLLPSGSWAKVLAELPSHFGEEVSLDEPSQKEIAQYLQVNAAEHSSARESRGILKSLSGQTPLRITETRFLQKEHHDLDPGVFSRPSVGSRSNCAACHTTAEQGVYEDDFVKVPK